MAEDPDVISTESASSPDSPEVVDTTPGPGSVTPVQGDRPVENAVAEFHRKFTQMQRQLDAVTNYLSQAQATRPAAASPAPSGDLSDDDLWRLAQQGDRQAFDLYTQRKALSSSQALLQQEQRIRVVDAQLAALGQMYPVLNDPSHPLTQTVQQAYYLLVNQGYPQNRVTLLDATKTAIADRPDLVAEMRAQVVVTRDMPRRSASQVAQAGQMGAASRATPPPSASKVKPLTKEEEALARRMGVKDPQKAKERFLQRQADGRSNLGAVGQSVREEEF